MVGLNTLKYYWNIYQLRRRGLEYSKDYKLKLYNWFPPFMPQDLWLSKFIEGRGLLNNKSNLKAGVFTVNGPQWVIRKQPCDLKIFLARENLTLRPKWHDFMLNEPCIDLSIGFDNIKDNPKYIHIPFWLMWSFDPMETYDSIKKKIDYWNSPDNKSYEDRKFCGFLCSHGDEGREKILHELESLGKVYSAGKWMHNDDSLKLQYNDDKIQWLSQFRFNLCPENSNSFGYVTEKLLDSISSGCVPVYSGSENRPNIDVFNKDAIIFFEIGEDNCEVLKLIDELEGNEKLYMDFACQNRFVDGAENVIWTFYLSLETKIKKLIERFND